MKNKFRLPILMALASATSGGVSGEVTGPPTQMYNSEYAAVRGTAITLARETGDFARIPQRKFRGGLIGVPVVDVPAPVVTDAKGGMVAGPKGAMVAAPPVMSRWEIFGGLFYLDEEVDQLNLVRPVAGAPPAVIPIRPEYQIETIGGMAGVRYMINENWGVGGLVNYSESDVDANIFGAPIGSLDVDNLALVPFVDFIKKDVFANADLWAGFSYAYGMQDYEVVNTPVSFDGETNTFELGAELAFDAGVLRHGPFVGLRYIDGEVDIVPFGIELESFASTLGYQVSFPIQVNGGKLVPQLNVAWEHEFEDSFPIVAFGPTSTVDEDLMVAGAGIGWYADSGWNIVLDYRGRFGSEAEAHYVGLKAGFTF